MRTRKFDYEEKIWGTVAPTVSPTSLQALELDYTLLAIKNVTGRLIDIGCGAGGLAKTIKALKPNLEVYGVDTSKKAISLAEKNPKGVKFQLGKAEKLKFNEEYFSAALMLHTLEHLERPQEALKEARRVLKNGGIIHLFVPLEKQPPSLYWALNRLTFKLKSEQSGHVQFFDQKSLEEIIEGVGFRVISKRFSCHLIYQISDLSYYSLANLLGKKPRLSLEGYLGQNRNWLFRSVFLLFKNTLAYAFYCESKLLAGIVGGGVHLTAIKYE